MIVAMMALILALGGTAGALKGSKTVDKNDLKKNVVKSKNIKNAQVQSADIGNGQVKSADIGDGQVQSTDIGDGQVQSADLGASAVPRAYALVTGDNQVDEARSKGITDAMVDLNPSDAYCFYNLGFQPRHVQATTQWIGGQNGIAVAALNPPTNFAPCGPEQASVVIFRSTDGGILTTPDFFVAFYD